MTNSLAVAKELVGAPGVEVLITGGTFHRESQSFFGPSSEASLTELSFDTLLLEVDSLDPKFEITAHRPEAAALQRKMLSRSRQVVAMAESARLAHHGIYHVAALGQIHTLVTDAGLDSGLHRTLQLLGVQVLIVE